VIAAAVRGTFQPVITGVLLGELVRNLRWQVPAGLEIFIQLFEAVDFIVIPEAPEDEIARWRDSGFETDAPIVTAAFLADIDYFCTGDRKLLARLTAVQPPFASVTPRVLLAILQRPGAI
jgi:hypothetical protein